MDLVYYRDVTEIALNNFKIQENYKNADIVLKMFISIGDLIYDSLDAEGYIQTNNFLLDGSDAVYRRLIVIAEFLANIKPFYSLSFRKFDRVKLNEIKWTIKDILKAITPHISNYGDSQEGFEHNYPVYLLSHQVAYSRIGKLLQKLLDFVKDHSDLAEWKLSKELLFIRCQNEGVHIKPDKKVITVYDEKIATIQIGIHAIAAIEFEDYWRRDDELQTMESYDWEFENYSAVHENHPSIYVYKACRTVDKLLEIARFFQHKISMKQSFSFWGILWIIKMCNALLIRGYFCRNKLTLQNIKDLLNIVFSVVDRLVPEAITTKSNETFMHSIYEEILCTKNIFYPYEAILLEHDNLDYHYYYDVIYKFISVTFNHYCSIIPKMYLSTGLVLSEVVINRPFLPNKIGSKMEHWNVKFESYSNISELLSANDLLCTICQKKIVQSGTEIAIPERCNHLSCSSCLMDKLNIVTNIELKNLPKSFTCPNSSCEMKHTGFVTDGQYDRLRTEAMEAMYDLD